MLRFAGVSRLLSGCAERMNETFGARLRRLRLERGLDVPDLASAVGVSEGAIRQLEAGRTKNPPFALGLRLSDQLNVDPHYLARGVGFSVTDRLDRLEGRVAKLERATVPRRR
jgi:transcriptional regulator with XRE-family HTH domain